MHRSRLAALVIDSQVESIDAAVGLLVACAGARGPVD